jgi:hypothetical protein
MWWRVIEGIAGTMLAWATLRDLFDTVVVPGRTRGVLKVSRRMVRLSLPIARRLSHGPIGVGFAPLMLGGCFVVWMVLLVAGFGLVLHAFSDSFAPPLQGIGHALYISGGAMATVGVGTSEASGWAAFVIVVAGFCGLASMTLGVTYLLEVQGNIAQRDIGVLKITTTTGQPPCALTLLERYAALGSRDEPIALMREGREWCAAMLQSHVSHPWLVYFRSVGTRTGWPAAVGALVDLALIAEYLLDEPGWRAPAVFAREEADRLAEGISGMISIDPVHASVDIERSTLLCARLIAAGYRMNEGREVAAFAKARERHTACIRALAQHLGSPEAPLMPQ